MISMPPPVLAAIAANASLRAFSSSQKRSKTARSCPVRAALSCVIACLLFAIPSLAQQPLLTRHVREAVLNGQAQPLAYLPATQIMQLDIVLPLSDQAGLDAFLKELYDPASPSYRHFLTVQEFTARFGPSQADYDAVVAFAKANGFAVVGGTRDGMEVQVKGPVSVIETAFHVNMRTYQHPTENRTFFAPDREPTANLPFRLWHISGLDNYSIPHPMLVSKSDFAAAHGIAPEDVVTHATTGSGPSASFLGSDMRAAYYGGGPLTGAGQNLGLWEYLGTDLTDLNTYFTNVGQINNVPVTLLSVDGTSTSCVYSSAAGYCDDTEQTIDMTQAIGMAPGLASLTMYVGAGASGTTGADDTGILAAMTTHNPLPTTIGCSWGWAPADPSTADPYFERMAAQGQNFFAASGDSATWSSSIVVWPADDANVVSVGGTDLVTAGAGGPWASETAWVDSGGGISPNSIAIPAWQQLPGVINSSNQGSTTLRNGPDVSANANWSFYVCGDQTACTTNHWGGTSFAAPMWAGYIALVNQQLAANGESSIGFLNPTIYAQNVTSDYAADFHDITSGTSGSYSAVPGYDLVTGWGSPNGQNLIDALGGAPVPGFTLSISPASLSINRGASGTATITVNDWNGFAGSVNLAASGLPGGVTASFSPNPATGTSALTLSASNAASIGTFNVTLTGASGSLTASTVLSLVVVGSIQITAPPPVNFGAVNIGTTSRAITLVFTVDTAGVFGSKAVFTQGATGRDFADAGTGTCAPNTAYSEGQTCTVNVTFTPQFAGTRYGALVLNDTNGYVISTVYLQGAGAGPQIAFQPGAQSTLGSGFRGPTSVTVDGSGNLYVSDSGSSVLYEMLAVNGTVPASPAIKTIGSGFGELIFVTIDGSGNLYVADAYNNAVKEVVAVNGSIPASPTIITLGSGFEAPDGVAVDGSGNVYVADMGNNAIKEIVAVDGSIPASPTIRALGSGFFVPTGVAVDGSGNVYVSNHATGAIREILAVNGSIPASPTIETLGSGFSDPWGVTVDASGNVYVADYGNSAVKEILAVNGSIPASPTIRTLGSGFNYPIGVAVDGSDNVFVADTGNSHVVKLDLADPPSLSFANTVVGSTSTDSPQTVTVANVGNAALSFPIPVSGNNPLVSANFTLNSSGASACPLINSGSSTAGTLAAGASCQLPISFTPTTAGTLGGSLALTDSNLNAAAPGYATQSITLSGTGTPAPSFTLGASPASLTVIQGASGTSTITVTGQNGFTGSVTLAASGLPSGVTASFTPNPTTGSSVLTLTASGVASLGTYTVTITGTSGSLTATTTVALTVNPPPTFTLSASPASLTVIQGASGTSTIAVAGQNGFTGSVTLAASSLPSGVTAAFATNPTTGSSVLTLTASNSATVGTAWVTITGTSGSLTATTTVALTVNPAPTFTLSASPASLSIVQSALGTSTIMVTGENGFAGNVSLAASGLPSGVTAAFSPNPTTGSSVLTLTASSTAALGPATVTITGIAGNLTEAVFLALTVNPVVVNAPALTNFGAVNIGTASPVIPLTFTVVNGGTLGSTAVLTQGATGLDFADAGSDTCAPNTAYTAGQTCTVNVTFTPRFAGTRNGAVVLDDINGNVLATGYLQGTGVGPQIAFQPGAPSTLVGFNMPSGVAVDGSGDVYVADFGSNVLEIQAVNGSIPPSPTMRTLGSGFDEPLGVAVDGSGNVYVADSMNSAVKEILAVNGSIPASPVVKTLGSGFNNPGGVAVDRAGNVFVADYGNNALKEILAVNGTIPASPTIQTLATGMEVGYVAVDGSGNVYFTAFDNPVMEILAVNGSIPASPTIVNLGRGSNQPTGIAVDNSGNVFITDNTQNTVSEIHAVNGSVPSSPSITILSSGFNTPLGLAVDASGNVLVADYGNDRVAKLDFADPPSLTFASTDVGTCTDSPQTVTVENIGNATLTFPIPSTGNNPSIATNFTLNSSGSSACPLLSSGSPTAGTLAAGASCQLPISFTPTAAGALNGSLVLTDTNLNAAAPGYATQGITLNGTGTQATPAITWATPAAITYGTPLSATQLNASSTVAGTFAYSPLAGTVLSAGQQTLKVTFTPTDTTDYTTATASVTLTVNKATPTITWAAPAAITYGTPLSTTQLNATASVAGTFAYSPLAGTVLSAGQQTLTATFTPTDTTDYTTATATVTLTVNQATPTITWPTPAAITYGTPLSATQLNASSTVAGNFTYSPLAGTVLGAGQQTLTATFTPTDTTDYTTVSASVTLTVNKATPTITWATPAAITYGAPLSATQLNASSTVAGTFTYSPAAGTVLNAGQQTLTATFTPSNTTDYTTATATVTLTVNHATPTITWPTPAAITYGTPLSATQLDATASVSGTFTYNPAAGSVPAVGTDTLTVTFTPANTTDYTTATASVVLKVNPAPSFTLGASPASLTVAQGASGKSTITLTGQNGFTGSVTLAASGLPLGVTAAFATNPTTGSSVLTLTASSTATTGAATVTIKGTSGSLTATTTVALTVNPPPTFTLSASPASLTVAQGASGKSTITVSGQNGFTGSVTLAASGLPSGVTAAFATNPTTSSSVLTLTASSTAAPGAATVTIKGTSGSLSASTTIALTISCTPTTIAPYISVNGGSSWTEESSATVSSTSTVVDLGPQPTSGGSWSWTGPNKYTSTSRQINDIPLTVGTDLYVATYTNANECKSTETFTITVK